MAWLGVEEAKLHLGKTRPDDDEELYGFITAAEAMVDNLIGVVRPPLEPITESHLGARQCIVLRKFPVAAIQEVVSNAGVIAQAGASFTTSGWYADDSDLAGGVLRFVGGWWPTSNIFVTYFPGRLIIPGNVRLATLELVAHLWQASQNAGGSIPRAGNIGGPPDQPRMTGFALPNRVRELLGLGDRATSEQQVG